MTPLNTLKALSLSAAMALASPLLQAQTYAFVSNAVDGTIGSYRLADNGTLTLLTSTQAGDNVMPLALSPDHRKLYASIRSEPFSVATFAVDPADGSLKLLSKAAVADSQAYISVDRTGHYLLGASYGNNQVMVNAIDAQGMVQDGSQQVVETGLNAHAIIVDHSNRFAYATNLGSDQLLVFTFDEKTGRLTQSSSVKLPKNAGPRHAVIATDNRFLYLLGEMAGTVTSYSIDQTTGALTEVASVQSVPASAGLVHGQPRPAATPGQPAPTLPENLIWCADIRLTPNGRFLYTSERTGSSVSVFAVDGQTGTLTYLQNIAVEKQPRGIAVDPSGKWLLVTGEKSDEIGVYAIDPEKGTLTRAGNAPSGKGANWVETVSYP